MHKKTLKVILVLCMVLFCVANGGEVFANGSRPGDAPTGGSCNWSGVVWWDTCFGYSWQVYEVIEDFPEEGIRFPWTKVTDENGSFSIRGCKKGQYLYNYGFEVHEGYDSIGYQISTQREKTLTEAYDYADEALGAYPWADDEIVYSGNAKEYLKAVRYASMTEAKNSYNKMIEYVKEHQDIPFAGNYETPWNIVGAFCYSPEAAGGGSYGRTVAFEGNETWVNTALDRKVSTKWVSAGGKDEVSLTVVDCPESGCNVRFRHALRRSSGVNKNIKYKIYRTSNLNSEVAPGWIVKGEDGVVRVVGENEAERTASFVDENGKTVTEKYFLEDRIAEMKPGQHICETLTFHYDGESDNGSTKACVMTLNVVDPVETKLSMDVRNDTMSLENGPFTTEVYAKPEDDLTYRAKYEPNPQYTYRLRPSKFGLYMDTTNMDTINILKDENNQNDNGIKDNTTCDRTVTTGRCTLLSLFTWFNNNETYSGKLMKLYGYNEKLRPWNNAFNMRGDNDWFSKDFVYKVGDSTEKIGTHKYTVAKTDVGKSLNAQALTNNRQDITTTPKSVTFEKAGEGQFTAILNVGRAQSNIVYARVPYNFKNTVEDIKLGKDVVYAGENNSVSYTVKTDLKPNTELGDSYATIVKDAKWKAEACYSVDGRENCLTGSEGGSSLHEGDDIYRYSEKPITGLTVPIPDVPAGTKIRVKACVYPATSGDDLNWQDKEGDHEWACSSKELIVAKRPSFQVWGGSVYSPENIEDSFANKLSTAGRVFGSWAELGVIAGGEVRGLASGAGLGYANSDDAFTVKNGSNDPSIYDSSISLSLGGGTSSEYCKMSTLSFANENCNRDNTVGNLSGGVQGIDGEALVARFAGNKVIITDEEMSLGGIKIEGGTTLYSKDGDLYISDDIKYKSDASYTSLADIPKIIIYASGDISIDCTVNEIDAVLIAEKTVNTCVKLNNETDKYETPSLNSRERSNRLVINGAIIANTLELNRTYGAATGVNSIVPAEIINYDTSLYSWASGQSGLVTSSKDFTEAYTVDLAPRY